RRTQLASRRPKSGPASSTCSSFLPELCLSGRPARHPADCPPDRVAVRVVAVNVLDLHHAVRARGRKNVACQRSAQRLGWVHDGAGITVLTGISGQDRKSTRLNSSHVSISYAVFCLKKKK